MKRPRSPSSTIVTHYNQLGQNTDNRKDSKIYRLRCFNNWVKSVMINKYLKKQDRVLDIGCGRGGDLIKYSKAEIQLLIGYDISESSITAAKARYISQRNLKFKAEFYTLDCFQNDVKPNVFDAVCCQFCLHYAFESEQKTRQLLRNVSNNLKEDGLFFGCSTNPYWLLKKAREQKEPCFGNEIYSIKFDQIDDIKVFGHKYNVNLLGALDECPEYLVHWKTLETIAKEYKLTLQVLTGFHEFYKENEKKYRDLLLRMEVLSLNNPKLSMEEWEVAEMYFVFCFKRQCQEKKSLKT